MSPYEFPYRADVQGLRGLAVLLVVLYHAGAPLTGGYVGVDVFFVISGYVITGGLLKQLSGDSLSFGTFFGRRIKRLLPALAFMVSSTLLASMWLAPVVSQWRSADTGLAAALISANTYLFTAGGYFEGAAELNPFLHTWSLSVEEQFYLVFPWFLAILWRTVRARLQAATLGVATVFSVSLFLCVGAPYLGGIAGIDWLRLSFYAAPARAWEFAAGAIVALAGAHTSTTSPAHRTRDFSAARGPVGLAIILGSAAIFSKSTVFPGVAALLPVGGTVLLLEGGRLTQRALSHPWLTRLGDISYAWYLWHWPLLVFARATFPEQPWAITVSLVVSLGVAAASYRWIEEPIRRSTFRASSVAIVCVVLPVASWEIHTMLLDAQNGPEIGPSLIAEHRPRLRPCANGGQIDAPECTFGKGKLRVALVGDSNAQHHLPALQNIAMTQDITLYATTMLGCPFMQTRHWRDGKEHRQCEKWVSQTTQDMITLRPDVVILGAATDAYIRQERFQLHHRVYGRTNDPEAKAEAATEGLRKVIVALKAAHIRVLVVDSIPKFEMNEGKATVGGDCSLWGLRWWPQTCARSRRLDDPRWTDLRPARQVHRNTSADKVVDLVPVLCPDNECRMWDGEWLYHDATHLSRAGSLRTEAAFRKAIAP